MKQRRRPQLRTQMSLMVFSLTSMRMLQPQLTVLQATTLHLLTAARTTHISLLITQNAQQRRFHLQVCTWMPLKLFA